MRRIIALALVLGIAACAPPAVVTPFEPATDQRAFTLNVNGTPAVRTGDSFEVRTDDFELDATLERDRVRVHLVNATAGELRLHPDASWFVMPDGTRSALVTGAVSWTTRDDPQAPIVVPAGMATEQILIPRESLDYTDQLIIAPMFDWPLTEPATITVVLSVELDDEPSEFTLVFTGRPD